MQLVGFLDQSQSFDLNKLNQLDFGGTEFYQFVIDFDPTVLKIKNIVWQSIISDQVINFQPKLILKSF